MEKNLEPVLNLHSLLQKMKHDSSPLEVILVEDNPDDRLLFRNSVKRANLGWRLTVFHDGHAAENYKIEHPNHYADLVFLDLKLPKGSGIDLIGKFRDLHSFRRVPLFVFSGSESSNDISRAKDAGCTCYLVKPDSLAEYVNLLTTIDMFWSHPQLVYPKSQAD